MKTILPFEAKRLFTLVNIIFFVLFFIIVMYLVYLGVSRYNTFFEEEGEFREYERQRVHQYTNYEQYGFEGFRVLRMPAPLSVFCHTSLFSVESNVDVKDMVNISTVHKGRKLFTDNNGPDMDFRGIFFVVGSLLMAYFGLTAFVSREFIRNHFTWGYILNTIAARQIILNGYFFIVILLGYWFASLLEVRFSLTDTLCFVGFALYLMMFINFFYIMGVVFGIVTGFNKIFSIGAYCLWFIFIFVVPELYNTSLEKQSKQIKSNESVNMRKISNGMGFERSAKKYFDRHRNKTAEDIRDLARRFADDYLREVVPLNREIENNLNDEVRHLTDHQQSTSVFFPSSFFNFLSNEISSMGYHGYQGFLGYVMKLRERFYYYYVNKRHHREDTPDNPDNFQVESMIKDGENIYRSESILPSDYLNGMAVLLFYTLLVIGVGICFQAWLFNREQNMKPVPMDLDRMEPGKIYFCHSGENNRKHGLIRYLRLKQSVVIDAPKPSLYDTGTSLETWIAFETREKGLEQKLVDDILKTFGVTSAQRNRKIRGLDDDIFRKIYLALHLARKTDIYVFVNFLDRASRELEPCFRDAIDQYIPPHAIIIYFSGMMFEISARKQTAPTDQYSPFIAIDLKNISLR